MAKIEMQDDDAIEVAKSLRTMVKKIDWVLDRSPPKKPGEAEALDLRAKQLTRAAQAIEDALSGNNPSTNGRPSANVHPIKGAAEKKK
jgi:hypothetical protein